MTLYTLGYQGLSLDDYISLLKEHSIALVIDVRAVAWSRKPGFSKKTMQEGLNAAGIGYLHLESAGNPFRKESDGENILPKYRQYLSKHSDPLERIEGEMKDKAVCLTCFEKDPQECHRSIITEALLDRNQRLKVVHLGIRSEQLTLV